MRVNNTASAGTMARIITVDAHETSKLAGASTNSLKQQETVCQERLFVPAFVASHQLKAAQQQQQQRNHFFAFDTFHTFSHSSCS